MNAIQLKSIAFSAIISRKIEKEVKIHNTAIGPLSHGRDLFKLSTQIVKSDLFEGYPGFEVVEWRKWTKNFNLPEKERPPANFGSPAHLAWTPTKVENVKNRFLICQI